MWYLVLLNARFNFYEGVSGAFWMGNKKILTHYGPRFRYTNVVITLPPPEYWETTLLDPMGTFNYETIPGYFAQDRGSAVGIPAVRLISKTIKIPARFGLLDDSQDRWTRFVTHIEELNKTPDRNTKYKVIFFGRHGEGFHNVGEAKYGTKAWDDYWSKLNGDGKLVWGPDPELTATGIRQAVTAQEAWEIELTFGIPLPEKLYTSPLTRAMKTCEVTFNGVLPDDKRRAVVVENCREENGVHTCDKRRTKGYIRENFPSFDIEPGFTEDDTLWDQHTRETKASLAQRAGKVLDIIFENDQEVSHGGIINGFLKCLGRLPYALPTGGKKIVPLKGSF
ncbi:histidine phosphatase superfamily [Collybia nuda]|uniref:Histidine phosphatase superfamily n=1 Tax=Collybia nuda TaxID=64659 RepID=A0A9P6CF89_9AGAR|nr:histidine phosphatase superfamily [Collybia nuda]